MKLLYLFCCLTLLLGCNNTNKNATTENSTFKANAYEPKQINETVTIYEQVEQNSNYNSLLKLISQAEMMDDIKSFDDVTFFAPTNAAINALSDETYANLRLPQQLKRLQNILKYHIVEGEIDKARIISTLNTDKATPMRLQTLSGAYIALSRDGESLIISDEHGNTALVSEPDMEVSNGVIHGIDQLLIPMNDDTYLNNE